MDQNPLPRGSSQVRDRPGQPRGTVTELAKTTVAVEAEYPAHPPGAMIVVQMLRVGSPADRAHATLFGEQLVELLLPHAVALTQVVLTIAAVEPLLGLPCPGVVTGLAVGGVARAVGAVAGKVGHGLD